jgi:outer membrane protein assembly factor BamA
VKAGESVIVPERASDPDRPTDVQLAIEEGPRTVVRSVTFTGHQAIDEAALRGVTSVSSGQPFSEAALVADRERIDLEYRNRGYDSVVVDYASTLGEGDTQADIVYAITEGQRITVDHIIIVGNRRISAATIERELLLREGEPLGYTALVESRARLQALGLFRRSQITPVAHGGEPRRDLVVEVEEVPPTIFDFGPGVEGGFVLRTDEAGLAEERFELAPRGSIQIGRRNLWGKNRTATLFTRLSLRSSDAAATDPDVPREDAGRFYEYRVVGQFREPRVFETAAEFVLTGIVEQAKRSSFDFARREARAQAGVRLSEHYSAIGVYSFQRTELLNERFTLEQQPLIDRLFSQYQLSKLSGSLIRDSRDDVLDASSGTLVIVDAELAARALGSEVGFLRTYMQGFYYRQLPTPRRAVLALGARVGAAHGFPREVEGQIVQDLPASERFFAGGDTSVRGFTLDRLGNERTTSASGFPTGGNSVVVLNSELRVSVIGSVQAVGFFDAGNVFPLASDLDLTDLRPAAGFGVMVNVPGIGPIRVDLGFNLDPRELVPGTPERRHVLHILLGQAF